MGGGRRAAGAGAGAGGVGGAAEVSTAGAAEGAGVGSTEDGEGMEESSEKVLCREGAISSSPLVGEREALRREV